MNVNPTGLSYAGCVSVLDVHFSQPLSCNIFLNVNCSWPLVYTELCSRRIFLFLRRGNNFYMSVTAV